MVRPTVCLFLGIIILAFSACSQKTIQPSDEDQLSLNSILIFPIQANSSQDHGSAADQPVTADNLITFNTLLQQHFTKSPGVIFLENDRLTSLTTELGGNRSAIINQAGKEFRADGVLVVTVNTFSQRQGSPYSINAPATVNFSFALIETRTEKSLCSGIYEETQQSLLADIFSFTRQAKRGFQWITAEELASEGISEKIGQCLYLKTFMTE